MSLQDFTRAKIQARVEDSGMFCAVKYYNRENMDGVVKISYQISFNGLGHTLFGIFTLGIANIVAENSEIHHRYFDIDTNQLVGTTRSEARAHYYNVGDDFFRNSDFVNAANAFRKYNTVGGSNYKYRVAECMTQIGELVEMGNFSEALHRIVSLNVQFRSDLTTTDIQVLEHWKETIQTANQRKQDLLNLNSTDVMFNNPHNVPHFWNWNRRFSAIRIAQDAFKDYNLNDAYSLFNQLDSNYRWDNTFQSYLRTNLQVLKILLDIKLKLGERNYIGAVDAIKTVVNERNIPINLDIMRASLEALKDLSEHNNTRDIIKQYELFKNILANNSHLRQLFSNEFKEVDRDYEQVIRILNEIPQNLSNSEEKLLVIEKYKMSIRFCKNAKLTVILQSELDTLISQVKVDYIRLGDAKFSNYEFVEAADTYKTVIDYLGDDMYKLKIATSMENITNYLNTGNFSQALIKLNELFNRYNINLTTQEEQILKNWKNTFSLAENIKLNLLEMQEVNLNNIFTDSQIRQFDQWNRRFADISNGQIMIKNFCWTEAFNHFSRLVTDYQWDANFKSYLEVNIRVLNNLNSMRIKINEQNYKDAIKYLNKAMNDTEYIQIDLNDLKSILALLDKLFIHKTLKDVTENYRLLQNLLQNNDMFRELFSNEVNNMKQYEEVLNILDEPQSSIDQEVLLKFNIEKYERALKICKKKEFRKLLQKEFDDLQTQANRIAENYYRKGLNHVKNNSVKLAEVFFNKAANISQNHRRNKYVKCLNMCANKKISEVQWSKAWEYEKNKQLNESSQVLTSAEKLLSEYEKHFKLKQSQLLKDIKIKKESNVLLESARKNRSAGKITETKCLLNKTLATLQTGSDENFAENISNVTTSLQLTEVCLKSKEYAMDIYIRDNQTDEDGWSFIDKKMVETTCNLSQTIK